MTRLENGYARLIGRMVAHSGRDGRGRADPDRRGARLRPVARADRLPADRGPGLSAGRRAAARRRLARAHPDARSSRSPRSPQDTRRRAGHHHRRHLGARQQRRRSPTPASPTSILEGLERARQAARICARCSIGAEPALCDAIEEARVLVLPPPPIQGIGNAGGFTMQVELRDGSFDYAKLQAITNAMVANAGRRRARLQRVQTAVPRRRAADRRRRRPGQGADAARHGRPGVLDARRPISARPTSTSSTSSAARSRSTCRPMRSSA